MKTYPLSLLSRHGLPVLLGLSALIWAGCGSSEDDLFDTNAAAGGNAGHAGSAGQGNAGTSDAGAAGTAGSGAKSGAAGKGGAAGTAGKGGAAGTAGKGGAAGAAGKGGAAGGAGKGGAAGKGGGPAAGAAGKGGSGPGGAGPGGAAGKGGKGGAAQGGAGMGNAGSEQGGTEQGGSEQGGTAGTEQGGSEQGGTEQGGTAGSETGGTEQGGTAGSEVGGSEQGGTAGSETGGTEQGGTAGSETGGSEQGGTAGTEQGGTAGSETGGTEQGGTAGTEQGGTAGSGPVEPADTCPGAAVQIGAGTTTLAGDTSGLKNDAKSGNNIQCGGGNSNDAVYQVTVTESGTLSIQLDADFRPSIYLRKDCSNEGSAITCNANGFGNSTNLNNLQVFAGATFSLFVDGYGGDNQAGSYSLSLTLVPSVCGNGTLEVGEECDDGGTAPGDGCSNDCHVEINCVVPEAQENSFTKPQKAPDGCATAAFTPASISQGSDNDWYCINAKAGQTILAETYVDKPGSCPNADTVIELFAGLPNQQPNNSFCVPGGNDIVCDDDGGPGACSRIKQTVAKDGNYCIRVIDKFTNDKIDQYGLLLAVE